MNAKQVFFLGASAMSLYFLCACNRAPVAPKQGNLVRLAELEIDPAQLENYRASLKEEIEASIRIEPGVLNLYAVAEKENPSHIRIFEIYADQEAYKSHLETPHFKKYKTGTTDMVKSLKLVEATPVMLGAKTK